MSAAAWSRLGHLPVRILEHSAGRLYGRDAVRRSAGGHRKDGSGYPSNAPIDKINGMMADPVKSEGHSVVDLGDDFFTRGKPHPMIDPEPRNARLIQEAEDSETAVVLFDVFLGFGSHEDPAGEVAKAIEGALVSSPDVLFVGSVTGTGGDPQNLKAQRARLAEAGVLVADTHVEACLAAAAALKEFSE